jgi:hypothetical protein
MSASDYLAIIRQHYPGAITTVESVDRLFDTLHRRYALTPHKIMLADSICSDDVNSIEYPPRAYEMLGPFKMGGLDGFPFTGLTGMGAFAAHVPNDGAVFVYHAPHIGIDKQGVAGQIMRDGQIKASGCCGACRAALAKLQRGEIKPGELSELDYQQNTIEQILLKQAGRINGAANALKEATEVMHEAITERIDLLASRTSYDARYLILIGGILINSDADVGSFTELRRALVKDLHTGQVDDILEELLA